MSIFSLYILALYFFSLSAVFLSRFINIRIGNVLGLLGAITAFGMAAFRPDYFPDMESYELIFEFAASGDFNDPLYWVAHTEPGFKILSYSVSQAGLGYSGLLLTMAAISCSLLFYISRISGVPFSYLWFTYFSFFFITRDLGVIRLSIASHLIVIFFLQRAVIWQALTLMTATLSFQYFAVVAVLAKPLSRIKINWLSISLLFLISFLTAPFLTYEDARILLPEEQANNYAGNSISSGGVGIIIPILRNLFFASFLYYFYKNQIRFRQYRLWIWAAFLSVSFYIMASGILLVAQRFSAYFGAIIPLALAVLMIRQSARNDRFFLVVFVCLLNFISLFYFNDFVRLDYRP